ncbi:hypothetical protein BpHYR1_031601 [Brachionus plicatilis]|uniref:Uncharacterized protein n=1 Tax=Brachionus plicatilis TaxID=10195 RepID=A0A3M7T095_BRAPC|nr:hypothetical protein BpHYR1_031601 [Brachionus plicatilis]
MQMLVKIMHCELLSDTNSESILRIKAKKIFNFSKNYFYFYLLHVNKDKFTGRFGKIKFNFLANNYLESRLTFKLSI